jgi:hypothetical protein
MRCSGGGTFLPPCCRSTAKARVTFHRQRTPNIGAASNACTSTRAAEPLAQRQAPSPIDPRPQRSVNHELHAAPFVEETLEDDPLARWHDADGRHLRGDVSDCLGRAELAHAALALEVRSQEAGVRSQGTGVCGQCRTDP